MALNCPLLLASDQRFFLHVGGSDMAKTVLEMLAAIRFADSIFRSTDFDGDKSVDKIGFLIANIILLNMTTNNPHTTDPYVYLDNFSKNNFENYCLAVAFTFINFDGNLDAITFTPKKDSVGEVGICRGSWLPVGIDGSKRSFNTVAVSFFHNGTPFSQRRAYIALVHELGHAFGSDDDDNSSCILKYAGNRFLMHSSAARGTEVNSRQFSKCSVRQMNLVLTKQAHCFTNQKSVCGNTIIEDGEDCDCGSSDICDLIDKCCVASDASSEHSDKPCTLRTSQGAQCSSVTSPCCTSACKFIPKEARHVCQRETDCSLGAVCSGFKGNCPSPVNKPAGTRCHSNGPKYCENGVCNVSTCLTFGLEDCLCRYVDSEDDLCKMCCRKASDSPCLALDSLGIKEDPKGLVLYRSKGEACNDYRGVCTSEHICEVHEDIFMTWITIYWQHFIIVMVIMTVLCFWFMKMKKKLHHFHTKAFALAKLDGLVVWVEQETEQCTKRIALTQSIADQLVHQIETGTLPHSTVIAVARLRVLFPTVPTSVLVCVAHLSSSEEVAVKLLLCMQFPLAGRFVEPSLQLNQFDSNESVHLNSTETEFRKNHVSHNGHQDEPDFNVSDNINKMSAA